MKKTGRKMTKKISDDISPALQHTGLPSLSPAFLDDLRHLITETRSAVTFTVNAGMKRLYWRFGVRIRREIFRNERAGYDKQILHALSAKLRAEFGEGSGFRNLFNMIRLAGVFPDEQIVRHGAVMVR